MSWIDADSRSLSRLPFRLTFVPTASVLIGSAVATLPIVTQAPMLPPLGFMILMAWRLMRSDIWPVWVGIPLGFFDDLMSGQPVGSGMALWTIVMLVMDGVDQRVVWRDYRIDWIIGAVAMLFILVAGALLARAGNLVDIFRLIGPQYIWSVFLLPLAMLLTGWLDNWRLLR